MIYAQIKNNLVQNCIVLDNATLEPLFLEGFDYLIRIDNLDPQPGIGYSFDGQSFSPPIPQLESEE